MKRPFLGLWVVGIFIGSIVLAGIFAPLLAPHDPYANNVLNRFGHMSLTYPLGTDHLGRCILSRMIFGIRPTVFYAFIIMAGTMGLGTVLGLISGYSGGKVDEFIMRSVDIVLSVPSEIVILAVVATAGIQMQNVILASILVKWAWYCRIIRCSVLKFRESPFVIYSKMIGMPASFIIRKHIMPNISAELTVLASLNIGWAILSISTLSFLGIGVQPPISEWGAMLNEARDVFRDNPSQVIIPGLALMSVVGAFNYLGDAIRDQWDSKEVVQ